MKRTVLVVVALLLITAAPPGCRRASDGAATAKPAPARVDGGRPEGEIALVRLEAATEQRLGIALAPVVERPLRRVREYAGTFVAAPGTEVELRAPVAGTVRAGPAGLPKPGAMTDAGLLLLVPSLPPEHAVPSAAARADLAGARAQAAAELESAKVRIAAAEIAVRRSAQLVERGAERQQALDEANAELALARAQQAGAEARLAALASAEAPPRVGEPLPLRLAQPALIAALHVADGQPVAAGELLLEAIVGDERRIAVEIPDGDRRELALDAEAGIAPLGGGAGACVALPVAGPPLPGRDAATTIAWYAIAPADAAGFTLGERVAVRIARRAVESTRAVPHAAVLHDAIGGTWIYAKHGERSYARERLDVIAVAGGDAWFERGPPAGREVVVAGAAELFGIEFGVGK